MVNVLTRYRTLSPAPNEVQAANVVLCDTSGNPMAPPWLTGAAPLPATLVDTAGNPLNLSGGVPIKYPTPPTVVLQPSVTANGNGTVMPVAGLATVAVQLTGWGSATANFEATVDGTNYVAVIGYGVTTGVGGPTATANGIYVVDVSAYALFRVRISGYASGTLVATALGTLSHHTPDSFFSNTDVQTIAPLRPNSLGDGANPIVLPTLAALYGYNGTTWDRVKTTSGALQTIATGAQYLTMTHTTLGVTGSSQQALASNTSRKYALFQNDSANVMYLKIAATAVADQGIRLNANGGSYEMTVGAGNLATGAVNAIGTATSTLLIMEGQ